MLDGLSLLTNLNNYWGYPSVYAIHSVQKKKANDKV